MLEGALRKLRLLCHDFVQRVVPGIMLRRMGENRPLIFWPVAVLRLKYGLHRHRCTYRMLLVSNRRATMKPTDYGPKSERRCRGRRLSSWCRHRSPEPRKSWKPKALSSCSRPSEAEAPEQGEGSEAHERFSMPKRNGSPILKDTRQF